MQKKLLVLAAGLLIGSVTMAQTTAAPKVSSTKKVAKKQMTDA
jgi:hypothetical protein